MKTVGIIAEYNPFHTGHSYQIHYIREKLRADFVVIVMSGDFVQRGTPALLDKYLRTKMALLEGADLVLELPVAFSTASAEFFAGGAVHILQGLGVVDELCFGCEIADEPLLKRIAEVLVEEPVPYRESLQEALGTGLSFPAARSRALSAYLGDPSAEPVLSSPNCILGIEYCKALLREGSSIRPSPLLREGAGYHGISLEKDSFPSAAGIRAGAAADSAFDPTGLVPDTCLPLLKDALDQKSYLTESDLDSLYAYRLLLEDAKSLRGYADLSPALADRINRFRTQYRSFDEFVALIKTKNLTRTHIQRGLLHMLLQLRESPTLPGYARVLGFQKNSTPLLSAIKKQGALPLLTKLSSASALLSEEDQRLLAQTTFASNLFQMLITQKNGRPFLHEYSRPVVAKDQ